MYLASFWGFQLLGFPFLQTFPFYGPIIFCGVFWIRQQFQGTWSHFMLLSVFDASNVEQTSLTLVQTAKVYRCSCANTGIVDVVFD